MEPKIIQLAEKKIIGIRLKMSFADYKVAELWKSFMYHRKEIHNNLNNDLISISVYNETFFENLNQSNVFDKWAGAEVSDFKSIPDNMEPFILKSGLYAVFDYRGSGSDKSIFNYIFSTWLPSSEYSLDHRPHFEVLGAGYKNNDPTSEEEIWIPIRQK
jgi:AraC family transcriptional regulator